jgi:uncharacterized protein Usg
VGRKHGPNAYTVCTVFFPMEDGGYLSQSFEYNHNQIAPEVVLKAISDMWQSLRSTSFQVNDFAKRFTQTTHRNRAPVHQCK